MGMVKFHQVDPALWHDQEFLSINDAHAALLYVYVSTSPHAPSEGLYKLPNGYLQLDLEPFMTAEEVDTALAKCVDVGVIDYDHDAKVVLDRLALRFRHPRGKDQIAGALRKVRQVPPTRLKKELVALADQHAPEFARALRAELADIDYETATVNTEIRTLVDDLNI